ncbi:MarR family transcriptional regulator [Lacticaseibacillus pabuli]|uniref:MarR family transcriptional regulator n=1 Tax=Lacticaseibacillus pabuli TaxID=3025672 RepID=A0ABY7WTZ0_9LACO|nr:MarR family transcriptional regulator [Lacticaseibacillus sp. KACC 23028]WDF83231.1 MarR family transcriptional regulator [Lacticaseibacillus sp. KACC 23028]
MPKHLRVLFLIIGISRLQGMALRLVNERSGITMTELAAQMWSTNSQLTGIITALEGKGLVARERNPDNRRVVNVMPTTQGLAVIQRNIAAVASRYEAQLGSLTPAEHEEVAGIGQPA